MGRARPGQLRPIPSTNGPLGRGRLFPFLCCRSCPKSRTRSRRASSCRRVPTTCSSCCARVWRSKGRPVGTRWAWPPPGLGGPQGLWDARLQRSVQPVRFVGLILSSASGCLLRSPWCPASPLPASGVSWQGGSLRRPDSFLIGFVLGHSQWCSGLTPGSELRNRS